ncbi:kinase-like protein [Auricularia subglabra TFB-10046 SS5]|nr:kinase-like protein [Auricularia subglabra TFB-10046 SS5]
MDVRDNETVYAEAPACPLELVTAHTFDGTPFEVSLQRQIGFGATATVFCGVIVNESRSQLVAVKVFRRPQDEHLIKHELQVTQQVARRQHPFILPFIGIGYLQRAPVIVSLYMKHGNISRYLRRRDASTCIEQFIQVGTALEYLHNVEGLVHGDLKPDNVLISNTGTAVLADLGLCTTVKETQSSGSDVCEGFTVRYAAPEILLGPDDPSAPAKTPASDVYAFGMLIHELLTGQRAWDGFSDSKVILEVDARRYPRNAPRRASRKITNGLWVGICRRCWERNPEDRPTLTAIMKSLQSWPAGEMTGIHWMHEYS